MSDDADLDRRLADLEDAPWPSSHLHDPAWPGVRAAVGTTAPVASDNVVQLDAPRSRRRAPAPRRLSPLRPLLAAVLVADLAAVGAHEVSTHSRPCMWGPWPIAQCRVLR